MQKMISLFLLISISISVPTFVRTIHRRIVGVNPEVYLQGRNMEYYYEREVRSIVQQMGRKLQRPPVNATIDKETGAIVPHKLGDYVDVEQTVYNVMNAPTNTDLEVIIIKVVPLFRTEHLEPITSIVGDFSTPLMGSPGRVTNLRLSLAAINNTLVMPNEVFSFNEVVGERTIDKGYKHAPIILGETVTPGVGGGVCQTSSTLYNAVYKAGLEIVERKLHSLAPSYIQHGRDAAVAWPYTDFKFRNDTGKPIIVKGAVQGWRVRVWIIGSAD